jgi:hypothetical protein
MKYTIRATKLIYLVTEIEADTLEEAHEITENELITIDFEEEATHFTIDSISAINERI